MVAMAGGEIIDNGLIEKRIQVGLRKQVPRHFNYGRFTHAGEQDFQT